MKLALMTIPASILAILGSGSAHARFYDMYRATYVKGAFCSAIGGACAADPDPENAYFQNPAALEAGEPSFDFDGDLGDSSNLEPGMKSNNQVRETLAMAGGSISGKTIGFGVAAAAVREIVDSTATILDDQDNAQTIGTTTTAYTVQLNLPLAFRVGKHLSLGVEFNSLYYHESVDVRGTSHDSTTRETYIPPIAFTAGMIWSPSSRFRFGSWFRAPITYYDYLAIDTHSYANDITVREDLGIHLPYIWATGVSIMPFGGLETLFLDVDVIGTTRDGFERTYDSFSSSVNSSTLRQKGRVQVWEPHLGWRSPIGGGHGKHGPPWSYMLGSYYETSRWEGQDSRLHGTAGVAYKVGEIVEILAGADVAKGYFEFLFTFR